MKLLSFRNLRVLLLLALLLAVAIHTQGQRLESTAWLAPLPVRVYPINGDGDPATADYIGTLDAARFGAIDRFMAREAQRHGLHMREPTRTRLGAELGERPPRLAEDASAFGRALWSLRLRWWAWRHTPDEAEDLFVRIFVIYRQRRDGRRLEHSLGMQKGLIGVVNAFALKPQEDQNNLIIAHEMLHTLGARDKYDGRGQPVYPEGYANPDRRPLHPQVRSEVMAGAIALSETSATMARSLRSSVIGPATAREIQWLAPY